MLVLTACAHAPRVATPNASSSPPAAALVVTRDRAIVDALVKRDFAAVSARFDATLREKVSIDRLAAVWSVIANDVGAFRTIDETRSFPSGEHDVDVSMLRFERGPEELTLSWNRAGAISGLWFHPGAVQLRALMIARALLRADADSVYQHFSPTMIEALPEPRFAATLQTLRDQIGVSPSIERIVVQRAAYDLATVHCRGDAGPFDLRLSFKSNTDVLEGLYILPSKPHAQVDAALPSYADPAHYTERAVEVGEHVRGLPATLTLPASSTPVPAVVLVHGSGPQDRDETVLANRPFRDLALGLATRGIAVLRYEKRTFGANARTLRDPAHITFDEETIDDAVSAVQLLANTPGIDAHRIFVVGHSQGGMAAPRIAEREPSVRGMVLLAAPARPLIDLLLEQNRYLSSLEPQRSAASRAALAKVENQVARVKSDDLASATPDELPMHVPASWWLSLRGYSQVEYVKALRLPTLILQGDRDFQVTATDFALWKAQLSAAPWATLKNLSGLNHLFELGGTPPTPADYERPSHVSEVVVTAIAEWIAALPPSAANPASASDAPS
jgi:pimeloyl-ACP methyl ester carboxylesterase